MSLFATKPLERILREQEDGEHSLRRTLGPVALIALGIGAVIGAGIFVITGKAAADHAGPGIVLYNVALAGLAIGLLILGFARPAPATA